ncbi:MAG: hypothetical protein MJE12_25425 [Alphaproteobacteria bacterium]|nr:hypothetical protein [Alphaproteobacteria bacterium]
MAAIQKNSTFIAWLIMLGLWAALHVTMAKTVAAPVFEGELLGPDGYMRLIRVDELRNGTGWYDGVIERSNAPYGDTLHWTRPMDVLILVVAGVAGLFTDPAQALFAAGAIVSPIVIFFACFVAAWAARPLIGRDRSLLAVFVLLLQPAVLSYTMLGRADHHSLQFLVFILCIGVTLRLLDKAATIRTGVLAGLSYGLALWVTVELLLLIALCQAALCWVWIRQGGDHPRALLAAGGAFLAITVLILLIERGPSGAFAVEFDRISIVHATLAAMTTAVWGIAWALQHRWASRAQTGTLAIRMAGILAAGGGGLVIIGFLYPAFFAGPWASVDPRIIPIWHEQVAELEPLLPTDTKSLGRFLFFLGATVPSLGFLAVMGWRHRATLTGLRWAFLGLLLAVYFALSLKHLRFAPFAEIVSIWVIAEMVGRIVDWSERALTGPRQFAMKCTATFALILGALIAGTFVLSISPAAEAEESGPECRIRKIAAVLNDPSGLGAKPLVIGGLLDHGPEILYRTRHAAIGAPYHRNGDGIWDSHRLLAATDEAETQALINRRGIDLILVCPSKAERSFFQLEQNPGSLYSRLNAGETPVWLTPVPLDAAQADGFRLYRVERPLTARR